MMTSKERIATVLAHEKPDRVPTNIGFEFDTEWTEYFDTKYGQGFAVANSQDLTEVIPALRFPTSPSKEVDGITWFYDPIIENYDELDHLRFPDPDDDEVLAPVIDSTASNACAASMQQRAD